MPQSRHRHKHHHQGEAMHHPRPAKEVRRSPVTIMVIFIGLLGMGVALLAAGTDVVWLLTGTGVGAVVGYFIGRGMDKLAKKNK